MYLILIFLLYYFDWNNEKKINHVSGHKNAELLNFFLITIEYISEISLGSLNFNYEINLKTT
jgi:hypothetical protein